MYLKEKLKKRRINGGTRRKTAFVPELSGMFRYYRAPCMIVKEEM